MASLDMAFSSAQRIERTAAVAQGTARSMQSEEPLPFRCSAHSGESKTMER